MKNGAFQLDFGGWRTIHHAVNIFEDTELLLMDYIGLEKFAHHHTQRVSIVLEHLGFTIETKVRKG